MNETKQETNTPAPQVVTEIRREHCCECIEREEKAATERALLDYAQCVARDCEVGVDAKLREAAGDYLVAAFEKHRSALVDAAFVPSACRL
jgi:hypothetical protein